jgi:hypothetical protein
VIVDHFLAGQNFRAPLVRVFFLDLFQLVGNDAQNTLLVGQNRLQFGDFLHEFGVLVFDFFPFEAGQPLQAHVQNRLRLIET